MPYTMAQGHAEKGHSLAGSVRLAHQSSHRCSSIINPQFGGFYHDESDSHPGLN